MSVCVPHNPTGQVMKPDALRALVELVERHGSARLLVDETYRELAYGETPAPATTLSARVIGVSSLSKAYGLPGLRIGWITCRDAGLAEQLLAAKEQIFIAGSLLDETMAARVLERRAAVLPGDGRRRCAKARHRNRMDGRPGALRVVRTAGRRRVLPAAPARATARTSSGSTARCCAGTAHTSARVTGSSRTGASSGSASAGRTPWSCGAGSTGSSLPRARRSDAAGVDQVVR